MRTLLECYKILEEYPNGMTKDQFYRVARINKQHAKYLLDSGLVPCINTGKKTRKYHIATHDVITYLCDREDNPEKYKVPTGFYIEKNGSTKMIYIKKVLYNNPVTVVWWSDGTVTRNRCPENVTYNPDTGLLFCITKRLLGNNDVAEIFNAWSLPENEEADNAYITLKDVRKTLREEGKLD